MKYVIEYHTIQSDHILATPRFYRKEVVEADSIKDVEKYLDTKSEDTGEYKKASKDKKRMFGFDYISNQGALKVYPYKPPKVKQL